MTIYDLLKILSSESKAKIIMHFLNCNCTSAPATSLCKGFNLKQANYSKHLIDLKELKIVDCVKVSKEIHYKINEDFAKKFGDIIIYIFTKAEFDKNSICLDGKCIHKS